MDLLNPGVLTATAISDTEIDLSWQDRSSREVNFALERSLDGTTFTQVALLAKDSTTYTDRGLTASTRYSYRVGSVDSEGAAWYSAVTSAVTLTGPATTGAAITLTSNAVGGSFTAPATISLSANPSPSTGATVSQVEFFSGATLICTKVASPYDCSYSNVAAGSYSLTAKVTDSAGNTATSAPLQISVAPASVTSRQVTLAWDANTETSLGGYLLSWGTSSGQYPNTADAGNATTFTVTGLQAGVTYRFVVQAYDSSHANLSGYSNEVSHTLQ
jgi:hypothetical protein